MPDNGFRFTIAVSEQQYLNKPTREDNIFSTIRFTPKEVTVPELLQYAKEGHAFSYIFNGKYEDGKFPQKGKTTQSFISTSTIIYDFDDMEVEFYDFIDTLEYKPSFAYTTASNGLDGKGYRYRLGYVFHHPIASIEDFTTMYYAIMAANGFKFETKGTGGVDKSSSLVTQVFFGTNPDADIYTSYYNFCRYDFKDFITEDTPKVHLPQINDTPITIDKDFLKDFNSLNSDEFFSKYKRQYYGNYKASQETPLILDESKMFYTFPDVYVAVLRKHCGGKTYRHDIGSGRLRKLFITAKIMLFNQPSLTIENLLFNLRLERGWYYVNRDGKLTNEVLINTAINAFKYECNLNQTKHGTFRLNKAFWSGKGFTPIQAVNFVRRYLKAKLVQRFFNPDLTYNENVKLLNDAGIKICKRTLQRMVTRGDIVINNRNSHTPYLSECRSSVTNQTTAAILELLKQDGSLTQAKIAEELKVDIRTVKRYMEEMKGVLIERVGNNRTGKWVVKEPQPNTKPQRTIPFNQTYAFA